GAVGVLKNALVVASLREALTDCVYVAGASARPRTIAWPSMGPRECAQRLQLESEVGSVAAVFGPEKSGLHNDDLDLCHTLLTIPTDPDFSSLNLAMAVQVLSYELRIASLTTDETPPEPEAPPATGSELENFYVHLEQVLMRSGFLDPENPRLLMRRLRRLFIKAELDQNEVNILRGMLAALDPEDPKDLIE
ncbi:MAG: tRNA (cytosine(32)/uridine(32)-2'-O)-methyltransferase TrmJ, partial [Nitrospirae bacterium]|nr:tRNA (cytosine(32)/uridine(32)-2'-O)-methyltransferase TrmJ [Nitrospirota bacterium]